MSKETYGRFTYGSVDFADNPDEKAAIHSFHKCIPDVLSTFLWDWRVDQLSRSIS